MNVQQMVLSNSTPRLYNMIIHACLRHQNYSCMMLQDHGVYFLGQYCFSSKLYQQLLAIVLVAASQDILT